MEQVDRPQQARELYEAKRFAEAGAIYHALWDEQGDAFSGGRYAYCLRKCGHADAALTVARQVIAKHPDDPYVRREVVWALYEAEVKPAREKGDLGRLLQTAQQIVELTDEVLPVRLVTFAVIALAKDKGQWDIVSHWCDRLDPQALSDEKREVNGRRILSEREQWYYAKIKALVQLKQWPQAHDLTSVAVQAYPRNKHFQRWSALALAHQGRGLEAVQTFEALLEQGASDWFLLADLAQIKYQLGQLEEALRVACRAALARGEDKAKVNLFMLLAQLGLASGQIEFAAHNVALARTVRQREGWSVNKDLVQLEQQIQAKLANKSLLNIPTDTRHLLKVCQGEWRKFVTFGQQRYTGQVIHLPESKPFGFIKPDHDGENIFVLLRDLPRPAQTVGTRVEFGLETSFDRKKNRESVRAVEVYVLK
jgi:tetratricopeptide (TPR) repeat protein/cold shock CspA family protein